MAITLNQLAGFLTVAREGSVSAAAEKLHVTQPSISAALAALSRELGVELTERAGRGIALTPAGEAFRAYAADVLGLIDQGRLAAVEAADRSQRTLPSSPWRPRPSTSCPRCCASSALCTPRSA
jgi:DNA-binding transcriptional LysR family regulator